MKIELSIVIPIYNEEKNIQALYKELVSVLNKISLKSEIVIINDGSSDSSLKIFEAIAKNDQRVKVIDFVRNFGQTAALSAGIENSSGDIIIPMDGDLQNDSRDIPKLLKKIDQGYSVVSGWRKKRRDSFSRTLPSWIANWIIRKVSGVPIHDNGCTLKAYRREVIEGVKLYGEMHRFISVYASWSGGKVTEVVVNHRPRKHGKSKYGFSRIFKVILDLFVIRFLHSYISRPIHFFGKYGFYSFALATGFIIWSLAIKLFSGVSISRTPLPIFGMMFFIVGIQLVLTGIMAELLMRTYYESQDKNSYQIKEIIKK
jgi:glycosyltransferase involved in cell wall biosynthesis